LEPLELLLLLLSFQILDDSKQKMLGPAGTTSSLLINGNGSPAMERRTSNKPEQIYIYIYPSPRYVPSNQNLFNSKIEKKRKKTKHILN
jgi:hypothetical protein